MAFQVGFETNAAVDIEYSKDSFEATRIIFLFILSVPSTSVLKTYHFLYILVPT